MLSRTVKGLKSELSANHLWEVGLSGYSRFSKSKSPLLLKDDPPDLLPDILLEELDEGPAPELEELGEIWELEPEDP